MATSVEAFSDGLLALLEAPKEGNGKNINSDFLVKMGFTETIISGNIKQEPNNTLKRTLVWCGVYSSGLRLNYR